MPDVLTIREAVQRAKAEGLPVTEYTLRQWVKSGAIPARKVGQKALLFFKTVRELQKQIETERAAGYVILSDSQGAGYYLSNDPVELRRFVNTLNARAANTIRASESAQRALNEATGQEQLEGW